MDQRFRQAERDLIRPSHRPVRNVLRVVGPLVMAVGGIFFIIGAVSFFSSFGSFEPPRYFWCAFVGIPTLAIGGMMTTAGYAGAMARYSASEIAPVTKDTFNYLGHGTKDTMRDVARHVVGGIREGLTGEATEGLAVACPGCRAENDAGSKFCDQCGQALPTAQRCPDCDAENDADARFCDHCGASLASA